MNFEVFLIFTYIILTVVTKKLNSYRNLKPYLSYRFYSILYGGLSLVRQRYKTFLAENMFVIKQTLSQDYLANYWYFLFPFFFPYNSTYMISSGNIELSTGKRLIHFSVSTFFFRRTNNNTKSEELIDKI